MRLPPPSSVFRGCRRRCVLPAGRACAAHRRRVRQREVQRGHARRARRAGRTAAGGGEVGVRARGRLTGGRLWGVGAHGTGGGLWGGPVPAGRGSGLGGRGAFIRPQPCNQGRGSLFSGSPPSRATRQTLRHDCLAVLPSCRYSPLWKVCHIYVHFFFFNIMNHKYKKKFSFLTGISLFKPEECYFFLNLKVIPSRSSNVYKI